MNERITVLLVDDHAVVRGGIRSLLAKDPSLAVTGEAGNVEEAYELACKLNPDVMLLDIQLSGSSSGLNLIPVLREKSPRTRVVVLSAFLNPTTLRRCLDEGVSGYLIKDTEELDLVSAVRMAAAGGQVFDPRVLRLERRMTEGSSDSLTPREAQVLELVCKGLSNADIAGEIGVSESAVKGYVSSVMRRLGCKNRVQMVLRARELNYI